MQQFGTEYKSPKNFQQAVTKKLKLIQQLYPNLRVAEVRAAWRSCHQPSSIPMQDPK